MSEIELELMPTGEIRFERINGQGKVQRACLLELLSGVVDNGELADAQIFLEDMEKIEMLIGDKSYCG